MSAAIVSIDGEIVPLERATISVLDRGLLYGDGLFEVLRTWAGVPVDVDAHLARLAASAARLQLVLSPHVRAWTLATLAATATARADVRIRIVVTRGPGAIRERLAALTTGGRTIIIIEPIPAGAESTTLAVVDFPIGALGGHKTLNYLDHVLARELAAQAGADDAIRVDGDDVVECATREPVRRRRRRGRDPRRCAPGHRARSRPRALPAPRRPRGRPARRAR